MFRRMSGQFQHYPLQETYYGQGPSQQPNPAPPMAYSQGYPPQGSSAPPQGYPPQGYAAPPQGYPPQGYAAPPQGYPPQGYAAPLQAYAPPTSAAPPAYSPAGQPVFISVADLPPPPPYSPPPKLESMVIKRTEAASNYQDIWATILFIFHLLSFGILCFFSFFSSPLSSPFLSPQEQSALIYSLLLSCAFTFLLGSSCFFLMKSYPHQTIVTCQILSILVYLGFAIFSFLSYSWINGLIWIVIAFIQCLFFYRFSSKIPFVALMLQTVANIMAEYPSALAVSALGVVLQVAWSVLYIYVIAFASGVWRGYGLYGILLFASFSYYWTSQVIKNTIHSSICGLFASYYFLAGTEEMPPHPIVGALKRTLSFSFGSVCFGSLIVALIKSLRLLVRIVFGRSYARFCLDCLLGIIDSWTRYFNHYAFAEIAIYGKSFCEAGKAVFHLFEQNGLIIIINDDLIGSVLLIAAILAAGGSFAIGFGMSWFFLGDLNFSVLFGLAALFVGGLLMNVLTEVVGSGASSTITCLAEDPRALRRTKPELYLKIYQTYGLDLPSIE